MPRLYGPDGALDTEGPLQPIAIAADKQPIDSIRQDLTYMLTAIVSIADATFLKAGDEQPLGLLKLRC
jgi:hypothetical protein